MISSHLIVSATLALGLAGIACARAQSAEGEVETHTPVLETDHEKAAFGLGYDIARQLNEQGFGLPQEQLLAGLKAGLDGEEPPIPAEELKAAAERIADAERARMAEAQKGRAATERAGGETFLAENGAREGVNTLAPGLQYEVLTAGDGATPDASDSVTVHYRGTLLDGTEFDSSYARGEPVTFPLNRVIAGWTQALTQMPAGSKWKLFVGPDLAYGDTPPPGEIPPGATLIFEVELLEIAP